MGKPVYVFIQFTCLGRFFFAKPPTLLAICTFGYVCIELHKIVSIWLKIYLSHDPVQFFVSEVFVYFQKDALRKVVKGDSWNSYGNYDGL